MYSSPNFYLIFGGGRLPPIFWAKFRKPTLRPTLRQPKSYTPLNHDVSSSTSPSPPPPYRRLLLRFQAVSSSDSMPPTSGKRKRQAEQSQRLL
ncbi:hypothetical protein ACLB2K_059994 [Fragaria x ananassa]